MSCIDKATEEVKITFHNPSEADLATIKYLCGIGTPYYVTARFICKERERKNIIQKISKSLNPPLTEEEMRWIFDALSAGLTIEEMGEKIREARDEEQKLPRFAH